MKCCVGWKNKLCVWEREEGGEKGRKGGKRDGPRFICILPTHGRALRSYWLAARPPIHPSCCCLAPNGREGVAVWPCVSGGVAQQKQAYAVLVMHLQQDGRTVTACMEHVLVLVYQVPRWCIAGPAPRMLDCAAAIAIAVVIPRHRNQTLGWDAVAELAPALYSTTKATWRPWSSPLRGGGLRCELWAGNVPSTCSPQPRY